MKAMNKTTLFIILVFVLSFSAAGIYRLLGGTGPGSLVYTLFGAFYMFLPAISVLIVTKVVHEEKIKAPLLLSFKLNRWFLVAWLLMPVIIFSTLGINLLYPGVSFNPEMTGFLDRLKGIMTPEEMQQAQESINGMPINILWIILLQGLFAGVTINALAAFGEELAWRGFLLDAFRDMKFYKASGLIGLIWGLWHTPLILMGHNYPQHPQLGVLMMVVLCMLITPLLLWVTLKAKSVIAAAIMHGTMNATAGISIMAINGGNDLNSGIAGFAGFITLALFVLGVFLYDRYLGRDRIFTGRISEHL